MTYKSGSGHRVEEFVVTAAFVCDSCNNLMLAKARSNSDSSSNDDRYHIANLRQVDENKWDWQPKSGVVKNFPDIPAHIAEPASEAFECESIGAFRASVLMARAVIEASAKEKGVTTGNLLAKIDKLAEQGHIRTLLAEAAHEVRLAGNDMAHGDFATAEITAEDADELLGLLEDFLRELFELPTRVANRRAKRSQ